MPATPDAFRSRLLEVREVLMFSFDFELLEQCVGSDAYETPAPWVPAFVVPGATSSVVGRDATGGVYVLCDFPERPSVCLHIDTRGYATPLGPDLEQTIALLVAIPYWHELLAEASALDEMRALAVELEQQVCDDLAALPEARDYLQGFLALPKLDDPVRRLYEQSALQSESVTVLSPHGWRYQSPLRAGFAHAGPSGSGAELNAPASGS